MDIDVLEVDIGEHTVTYPFPDSLTVELQEAILIGQGPPGEGLPDGTAPNQFLVWNGSVWSLVLHLSGDPHSQYFLNSGRPGGQIIYLGNTSGDDGEVHSNPSKDGVMNLGDLIEINQSTGEAALSGVKILGKLSVNSSVTVTSAMSPYTVPAGIFRVNVDKTDGDVSLIFSAPNERSGDLIVVDVYAGDNDYQCTIVNTISGLTGAEVYLDTPLIFQSVNIGGTYYDRRVSGV